jgi:uncharacterized protein YjbJ (UPF0337 family)
LCVGRQTTQGFGLKLNTYEAGPRRVGAVTIFNQCFGKEVNWDCIEGNWKQFKGNAKGEWGKLTDDQLGVIAGKRDKRAGKIQEARVGTRRRRISASPKSHSIGYGFPF